MKLLNDEYNVIAKRLNESVNDAKQVEEMEKFKYDLNLS